MENLIEKIKELLKHSRKEWKELYFLLKEAKDREIWKDAGYRSWNAFVKAIADETGVHPNHIYRVMRAGAIAEDLERSGVDTEKVGINKLDKFDAVRKKNPEAAKKLLEKGELERIPLKELDALAKGEKSPLEIENKKDDALPLHIAQNLQKRVDELERRLEELEKRLDAVENGGEKKVSLVRKGEEYLDDILGGEI